jgi:hypothetical protein
MNRTKFWHEKLTLQKWSNGQINIGSIRTQEASSFLSVCCKSQDKESIFVVVGNELNLYPACIHN